MRVRTCVLGCLILTSGCATSGVSDSDVQSLFNTFVPAVTNTNYRRYNPPRQRQYTPPPRRQAPTYPPQKECPAGRTSWGDCEAVSAQ